MAKKQQLNVQDTLITLHDLEGEDYISLTDMVQHHEEPDQVIRNWIRRIDTIEYLAAWESLYNPDFKPVEFDRLRAEAGTPRFTLSVTKWRNLTGAVGIISKRGRGGGTLAHRDIAFNFGETISPMFHLLLIREFQRLKAEESSRQQLEWNYRRFLTKVNYRLHTDTIKDKLIPSLRTPKNKEWLVYADEADLLNMAVFGQTAKQWREANPDLATQGNMRDFADVLQLNVMANLESLNAVLLEQGMEKMARFELLAKTAITQYHRLAEQPQMKLLDKD